jgi:DNA-binding transcriptional MerR regulator
VEIAAMRISELAKRANINVETIRYYEREGLLPPPARRANGYREFGRTDLERVLVIRSCRDLGFTLEEIRELLDLHRVLASRELARAPKRTAQGRMLATANRQLSAIEEKLRTLGRMRDELLSLIGTLRDDAKPVCPVSKLSVTH